LIHFAPLGGETFERLISSDRQAGLPDSLVVLTPEGGLLTRSGAVIHLLHRMGPIWRLAGLLLTWIPVHLRDWVYDHVARSRPTGRPCPREFASGDPRFKP
jgi:predicted DCC family thiol-disulfide oxidoreductase YuxK